MRLLTAGSLVRVQQGEPLVGVDGGEGTPVPIPNTAVKLISADNTWLEAAREDRQAPTQEKGRAYHESDTLFLYEENHSLGEWFKRRLMPMM